MHAAKYKMWIAVIVAVVILTPIIGLYITAALSTKPKSIGVSDHKFTPCPNSPNCVSSQSSDESHAVAPLEYEGDAQTAWATLLEVIATMPRSTVVESTDNYMHVEFRSLIFRFPDDVEFYLSKPESVIHIRSASRVGHSDFGANRERAETIRELFQASMSRRVSTVQPAGDR